MGCGNFNKSSSLFFTFVTSYHRVITLTQWIYAASPALALSISKELIHFQRAGIYLQGIPLKIYGEPIPLGIG